MRCRPCRFAGAPEPDDAGLIELCASSRRSGTAVEPSTCTCSVWARHVSFTLHYAGLDRYGWVRHDGASFGRQEIVDGGVTLTTSLVGLVSCSITTSDAIH